jgi:hypothetical protein
MKGAARMQAPLPQRINAKLPRLLVVLELRRHAGRDVEDESEIEYRREETGHRGAGSPETPSARRLKRLETDAYLSDLGPEFFKAAWPDRPDVSPAAFQRRTIPVVLVCGDPVAPSQMSPSQRYLT